MAVGRVFKKVRVINGVRVEDKNWCYRFFVNGQEFTRSSRSDSETVAKKMLRRAIEKSGAGALPTEDRVRFEDMMLRVENKRIEDQRRSDDLTQRRKHLDVHFAGMRAIDITTAAVDRYKAGRLKEGAKPATINRELALLRRGFNVSKLSLKPDITMFSEAGNERRDFLDWGDFCAVREHLPAWMADFCTVAFLTSWRQGQLAALEWRDVDMGARTMTARQETTKGGVPHTVPLVGEVWEIINRRHRSRINDQAPRVCGAILDCNNRMDRDGGHAASVQQLSPYVFTYNGEQIQLRGGKSPARRAWAAACAAAGFPNHYLHGLRRSGIRFMVQTGGMEAMTAMAFSGHKTPSMLQRYNIMTTDGLRTAMETATAKLPEQPPSKVKAIR